MLEVDALKIIKNCPQDNAAVIETRDIGGLGKHRKYFVNIETYCATQQMTENQKSLE